MKKVKILLSGIAGFIGSNLSRALLKLGHEILGIDDLSVGNREYLPLGVKFTQGRIDLDIFHLNSLDLIIHLASRKIPREGNPDRVLRENALGIMKVVEIAKKYDARIIYLSSSEAYGQNYKLNEKSSFIFDHPENPRWSYGLSKVWSENYLHGSKDIRFNIVRLFATYGPYNCRHWRAGPIPVFIEQALDNKPFTIHGGKQTRCFCYVDDSINAILKIVERNDIDRRTYNIGNPNEEISILNLAHRIAFLLDIKKPEFKVDNNKYEIMQRIPDIDFAKNELGFEPEVSLEEGLIKTIKWHKQIREQEKF